MLNLIDPVIYTPDELQYVREVLRPLFSAGWDDQKNAKFAAEFSEEVRKIDALSQKMIEHAAYLDRLCNIQDDYLSSR